MAPMLTRKSSSAMEIELFLEIITCMFCTIHRCVNMTLLWHYHSFIKGCLAKDSGGYSTPVRFRNKNNLQWRPRRNSFEKWRTYDIEEHRCIALRDDSTGRLAQIDADCEWIESNNNRAEQRSRLWACFGTPWSSDREDTKVEVFYSLYTTKVIY